MRFKFGIEIKDAPLLRADHKNTPKWAWPESRDSSVDMRDPLRKSHH